MTRRQLLAAALCVPLPAIASVPRREEFFGYFDYRENIWEPADLFRSHGGTVTLDGKEVRLVWSAETGQDGHLYTYDILGDGQIHTLMEWAEDVDLIRKFKDSDSVYVVHNNIVLSKLVHGHVQIWGPVQ